jgi:transcriptional regulator with XRE-family HTH domain
MRFGGLLRRLRDEAGLTQDELAEAARVSQRAISDLERGINATARKDTAVLLAGALGLDGPARALFVAAARGRAPAGEALAVAVGEAGSAAAASRTLPRDIAGFTGRQAELGQLLARWARRPRPVAVGWCRCTRPAGWPGSARPPSRCTPRTS